MQPEQGILTSRTERLCEQGRWEELEHLYEAMLREDSSDARTAYRLGNLLARQKRYGESLPCYETAWAYRWPGALPYNNKGVALACMGETRAAIETLQQACKKDETCAPAFYNLGILLVKMGQEGSLSQVLLDLNLGERDPRKYFEEADKGVWPVMRPCDRPLLLWVDDLRSGFGFETLPEVAEISDAEEVFQEGVALLRQKEWEKAISKLEAAARLNPSFGPRIVPLRTAARVAIVRQRRAAARKLWKEGDHEGAAQMLDITLGLSSDLPNRAFAEEILAAGIQDLARQIREHRPVDGWLSLQQLITAARQRIEDGNPEQAKRANGEAAPSEDPSDVPPEEAATEQGAPSPAPEFDFGEDEAPARNYIRQVCRQAWDDQIDHLVLMGAFEDAIQLLEFSEVQWFAGADLPRWRRRVYTGKAEALRAQGLGWWTNQEWQKALDCWNDGRDAAIRAEDSHLADSFETLIARLADSVPEARVQARRILEGSDDREDLRRCLEQLEEYPGDPRLQSRRGALIRQILAQAEDALRAHQWDKAKEIVGLILDELPEEKRAIQILRSAQEGIGERAAAMVERDSLRDRKHDESPYKRACDEYEEARAENDLNALKPILKMWTLQPQSSYTQDAIDWFCHAKVEALRVELTERIWKLGANAEPEGQPGYADEPEEGLIPWIESSLKAVLDLRPGFEPAQELRRAVRRLLRERQKRESALERLNEVETNLRTGKPDLLEILDSLDFIQTQLDPGLELEVLEQRDIALTLLKQQIERESEPVKLKEFLGVYEIHRPADRAFVAAQRLRLEPPEERAVEPQVEETSPTRRSWLRRLKEAFGWPNDKEKGHEA